MSTFEEAEMPVKRRGRPRGGGHTPEQAREALLDAAQHCFLQHGVTATTMDAIARQAGVTRAVVYRHFANRDELMIGLALRVTRHYIAQAAERFITLPDPVDMITESLVFVATEVGQDPLLTLLSARAEHGTVARLLSSNPELTDLLTSLYQAGLELFGQDRLRPGQAISDTARYILSIALALLMDVIPGTDDPDQIRRYVTTFVLPAILTDPPPPTTVFTRPATAPATSNDEPTP